MANLDTQLKALASAIASATGSRANLNTTDKTTFVAAINEIKATVDALGTVEHTAADITARDALTGLVAGDRVFVTDASLDATVNAGWAVYRVNSTLPNVFIKITEQESLDIAIVANLTSVSTATTVSVDIDTGSNVVLNGADSLNAGLMIAADKVEHDRISAEVTAMNNSDYTLFVNTLI